jgi:rhodanese-related sulfurtransferase
MDILIVATKDCQHRPILEKELQSADLPYTVKYFEEHSDLIEKYHFKHSPLLIVDEKVASFGMPDMDMINKLKMRNMNILEIRTEKRDQNHMIPKTIEEGLVEVDTTWGSIQPIEATLGVRTVGELDVYQHQKEGLPIVDARKPDTTDGVTIPGSENIPYDEIVARKDDLDENQLTIFFCNGPQCPQSATAIKSLVEAGYPTDRILYYRGGMHDWITLGLAVDKT